MPTTSTRMLFIKPCTMLMSWKCIRSWLMSCSMKSLKYSRAFSMKVIYFLLIKSWFIRISFYSDSSLVILRSSFIFGTSTTSTLLI